MPMSRPDTGAAQLRRLRAAGLTVATMPELNDVDTADDALRIAAEAPGTRFAAAFRAVAPVMSAGAATGAVTGIATGAGAGTGATGAGASR
nr:hypothetical protein GCM10020093_110460 [Planobispora longispora]